MTGPIVRDFPNIERLLCLGIYALVLGEDHVGTETPDNLEAVLPFIRVNRIGGPRGEVLDFSDVDVSYFDVDEAVGAPAASTLANLVMTRPYPHPALDRVDCPTAPRELPWRNAEVRHWGWSYQIQTRKVRALLLP